MQYKYGYFSEDGSEFVITDPKTPRGFDNFLWNDSMFSVVQQTGVGCFDYQIGNTEAIQMLTGVGRICDYDVFGRENLMSRLVYIRDNETGEFWNLNWEPVKKSYESYQCTHGLGYTKIETSLQGIEASLRIFVPKGADPVELWTLEFRNTWSKSRNISVFVYNQFQFKYKWDFNSYGDMIFRKSYFSEALNSMIANKHPHIAPHQFLTGFMTSDETIVRYDGSRDFFMGTYNGYNEPEAVILGKCSNSSGSSDATIGAVQYDFQLSPEKSNTIDMILGATDNENGIQELRNKYLGRFEEYFQKLKDENRKFISLNQIHTPDEHLNRMVNVWMKHQTSYGAKWCRWGYMGYRDIVQHGLGVSTFNPVRTREILIEAMKYLNSTGVALRGWNPIDTKPYSDSPLWLVYTLTAYLKETAEFDFLDLEIPFYDSGKGSVLNHIERALNSLENNRGIHGLCLIKFGDWNDSLTGIGKLGRGESVWLSMAYAEALKQMGELFSYLENSEKTTGYMIRYYQINSAINKHAWDGEWYLRCFDDFGNKVGSKENNQGKIYLNTQSWALISGLADKNRSQQLIASVDKLLHTKIGYQLLAPAYLIPDDKIGRISYLEPGICENGTVYSHVNSWMVLAFLRAGMPDKAYQVMKEITPGYTTSEDDLKQIHTPYVFANGYYGCDHRNNKFQMEFTWITGSVAWHYNNVVKEMIGIQPEYAGLRIDPKIPAEWENVSAERIFRGKQFTINIQRKPGVEKIELELNGKAYPDSIININDCAETNMLNVIIP
jgi:cellobiose phosphorylase